MAEATQDRHRPEPSDEQLQLAHVRDDLRREFSRLPAEVVEGVVAQKERALSQAPIRSFVPVLVRRGARERLRHLA